MVLSPVAAVSCSSCCTRKQSLRAQYGKPEWSCLHSLLIQSLHTQFAMDEIRDVNIEIMKTICRTVVCSRSPLEAGMEIQDEPVVFKLNDL